MRARGPQAAEGGGQATTGLCLWARSQGRRGTRVGTELPAASCQLCYQMHQRRDGQSRCPPLILLPQTFTTEHMRLLAPARWKKYRAGAQSRDSYIQTYPQGCSLHAQRCPLSGP